VSARATTLSTWAILLTIIEPDHGTYRVHHNPDICTPYLESPYDLIPSMDYISPNFYGDADGLSGYKELNLASVYTDANKCNQWMSEFPDNSPSNPVTPKIYFGILPAGSDLSILDNKGYNTTGNHVLS